MQVQPKQPQRAPAPNSPLAQQMIQQQAKAEKRVDESLMAAGKYEVTPDQTCEIVLFLKDYKGRWVLVDKKAAGVEEHRVVFRIWTFEEMIELRRRATSTDQNRKTSIDNDMLNRLKVQKLLVSWTFGEENPRLKINRVQGVLTDDSWRAFLKLSPNIAQKILDEMNFILEYGG